MPRKTFVCRCEDVTLDDVTHAVALGYTDIEEVKRYTGLGTGPCGGKECMALCARAITAATGRAPTAATPFTARPPVATVSLGTLAASAIRAGGGKP
jgi:sarcosine oxidase subunit beta